MGEDLGTLGDGKNVLYEILKGKKIKWSSLGRVISLLKVSMINKAETLKKYFPTFQVGDTQGEQPCERVLRASRVVHMGTSVPSCTHV